MGQTYRVTSKATEWAGSKRVADDGTVVLTEAQAAYDLARGVIEPVSTEEPEALVPAPEGAPRKKRGED